MKTLGVKLKEWALGRSHIDKSGSEVPDPTPVALPVGFERPESIQETIRRLVTDPQIRAELEGSGVESFEEADDFEVDDDIPPTSPYEETFDPLHLATRDAEIRAGAVQDRSPEEKAEARRLAEKAEEVLRRRHARKVKEEYGEEPQVGAKA